MAIQMASGTHGSQGAGARPVRAKRSSRAAPAGEPVVDAVHVRADPGGGAGIIGFQGLVAEAGGVGETALAGEAVPADGVRAEEGGAGALGPVPFDLQLPGAVEGGDAALGVGEPEFVGCAEVGDAPGVAEDLVRFGGLRVVLAAHTAHVAHTLPQGVLG